MAATFAINGSFYCKLENTAIYRLSALLHSAGDRLRKRPKCTTGPFFSGN